MSMFEQRGFALYIFDSLALRVRFAKSESCSILNRWEPSPTFSLKNPISLHIHLQPNILHLISPFLCSQRSLSDILPPACLLSVETVDPANQRLKYEKQRCLN